MPEESDLKRYPHFKYAEKCWITDNFQFEILLNNIDSYTHIKIHDRKDKKINDFYIFQNIKNLVLGKEEIAIQIYPKESDLKDGSNTYHLWTWDNIKIPNLAKIKRYH